MRLNSLIRRNGRRGNSIVEVTLMLPFIIFLFIAIFNFGFYAYALISVENAARAAAMYASGSRGMASDGYSACRIVLEELRSLPGIGATATCTPAGSAWTAGASSQISVFAQLLDATAGRPGPDGASAAEVAVTYQPNNLFPLPFLMGNRPFTRVVRMRI